MAVKEEKQVRIWQPTRAGKESIGSIFFYENVDRLMLQRTATGVNLRLPSKVELGYPGEIAGRPMLSNLRAVISLKSPSGDTTEVGIARDEKNYYLAMKPVGNFDPEFIWRDALAGLIFIEKNRAGTAPVLEIELRGELCYVVQCKEWRPKESGRLQVEETSNDVRTPPVLSLHESIEISYPIDVWMRMIQEAFETSQDSPLLALQSLLPFLTGNKQ